MPVWEYMLNQLDAKRKIVLLYVLESTGSSPGRQGFSMAVNDAGELHGSIGGGFMEHKLVELARSLMDGDGPKIPFIKKQIHRKDAPADQSGMICSGEQTVAFYFLDEAACDWVRSVIACLKTQALGVLVLNEKGIAFHAGEILDAHFIYTIQSDTQWTLRQQVGHKRTVYIIGGGHVGLALSRTMAQLGFYVELFDDRDDLNTVTNNPYAHKKHIVDYEKIDAYISEGALSYVVLVSFGYRTDKVILKKLINKNYKYLGMMGSAEKVKTLFSELEEEGVDKQTLLRVYAPIGTPIFSKTPEEIAVSIAAQIIAVKNSA